MNGATKEAPTLARPPRKAPGPSLRRDLTGQRQRGVASAIGACGAPRNFTVQETWMAPADAGNVTFLATPSTQALMPSLANVEDPSVT